MTPLKYCPQHSTSLQGCKAMMGQSQRACREQHSYGRNHEILFGTVALWDMESAGPGDHSDLHLAARISYNSFHTKPKQSPTAWVRT